MSLIPQALAAAGSIGVLQPTGMKITDIGVLISRIISLAFIVAGILTFAFLVMGGVEWLPPVEIKAKPKTPGIASLPPLSVSPSSPPLGLS